MSYSVKKAKPSVSSTSASSTSCISSNYSACCMSKDKDADCFYIVDSRKIQENVQTIKSLSSNIQKMLQATYLSDQQNYSYQNDLRSRINLAKETAAETQDLLRRFALNAGETYNEKSQRRLMHDKLSNNYRIALEKLENVVQACLVAEKQYKCRLDETKGTLVSQVCSNDSTSVAVSQLHSTSSENQDYHPLEDKILDNTYNDHHRHNNVRKTINLGNIDSNNISSNETKCDKSCMTNKLIFRQKSLVPVSVDSAEFEEVVKERKDAISQIEKDIDGINKLYTELAWHIKQQEGGIDDIENCMREAAAYAHDAVNEIAVSRNRQKHKYRKTYCLITTILISLMVIICTIKRY